MFAAKLQNAITLVVPINRRMKVWFMILGHGVSYRGDVIDITPCTSVTKFTWHNCITMRGHANTQAKECKYV